MAQPLSADAGSRMEGRVRALISSRDSARVLELVTSCPDPHALHVALREAVDQNQWPLVSRLARLKLTGPQKHTVCAAALASHQWRLAAHMLYEGVDPKESVVGLFFEHRQVHQLLAGLPTGTMPAGLRRQVLLSAVHHDREDVVLQVVDAGAVPDTELMDFIHYAILCPDSYIALHLLWSHSTSRRVFKQYVHGDRWSGGTQIDIETLVQMFDFLIYGGEKDLALHLAMWQSDERVLTRLLERCFCKNEDISLKKSKYKHAFSKLYSHDDKLCLKIMAELSERSQYNRRYLFGFALGQSDFQASIEVCGVGIHRKDLKVLISLLFSSVCETNHQTQRNDGFSVLQFVKPIIKLDEKMAPEFGNSYVLQLATKYAVKRLSRETHQPSLRLNIRLLPTLLLKSEVKFSSGMFKAAIRVILRRKKFSGHRVQFLRRYFRHADLSLDVSARQDCRFAFGEALRTKRLKLIQQICHEPDKRMDTEKTMYPQQVSDGDDRQLLWPQVEILVEIFLELCGHGSSDPLTVLKTLDPYHGRPSDVTKIFQIILTQVINSGQWDNCLPAIDAWLGEDPASALVHELFPVFRSVFAQAGKTGSSSMNMSTLAKLCLEKSHWNVDFVLAFAMNDWNTLKTMLTDRQYSRSFYSNECIEIAVEQGAVSVAVALFWERAQIYCVPWTRREHDRMAQAARSAVQQGLEDWTVRFAFSDWPQMITVLETCQDPKAVKFALKKAWVLRKWDYFGKLVERCTDPGILRFWFRTAVARGWLEVVRSLVWRVDLNSFPEGHYFRRYQAMSVLRWLLLHSTPATGLDMVYLCIEAGVSSVERRRSLDSSFFCPMKFVLFESHELLHIRKAETVQLLLQSGALNNKAVDSVRRRYPTCSRNHQQWPDSQIWDQCCQAVLEAAATPRRLKQLARLAVSEGVGSHPGRQQRIASLEVPETVREMLYFKDVSEKLKASQT